MLRKQIASHERRTTSDELSVWQQLLYQTPSTAFNKRGLSQAPLAVRRFEQLRQAFIYIEELHANGCTYNLLYRPGGVFVTPRAMQGSYEHASWTGGFAWSEIAGSITTFNAEDYARLADVDIRGEFAKLSLKE